MNKRRFTCCDQRNAWKPFATRIFCCSFAFFDLELHGLNDFLQQGDGIHTFEVLFVLDQRPLHLIDRVTGNDFRLFATPIINLFKRRCSPVLINGEHTEYPVIVDPLNPACTKSIMYSGSTVC